MSRASREQKMPGDRAELDAGWGAQLARHGYTAPLASGAVEAPETAQRVADVRSLAVEALGLGGDPKDPCTRRSSPMACGERASPAWRVVSSTRGRPGG